MDYSLNITGDKIVISNFEKMQKQTGDMRSAFSKIADSLKKSHEINFQSQGTRFGTKWPARKRPASHPLMVKSGTLKKSFNSSYNSTSATITNTAPYAKYHQTGTSRLPIRNLIGWNDGASDSDLSAVIRILRQHIGVDI